MARVDKKFDPSRRALFKKSAVTAAGLAIATAATSLGAEPAAAKAKMSQAAAKYQATPKKGQKCSACARFQPGPTATADGTCSIVAGKISPDGWCVMFTPK